MPVKKRTVSSKSDTRTTSPQEVSDSPLSKRNNKKILIAVAVVLIGVLLYQFRNLFVVATVNGQPVTRIEFIKEMEKQIGKQALQGLITKKLILQEAKKQNLSVNNTEIDSQIRTIEEQLKKNNQNLDDSLKTRGMTRADLQEQIKLQKLIEKMFGKDISVPDKEVNDYIEQNKDAFQEPLTPEIKENVKQQLVSQKLNEKFQKWIETEYSKAKINYWLTL